MILMVFCSFWTSTQRPSMMTLETHMLEIFLRLAEIKYNDIKYFQSLLLFSFNDNWYNPKVAWSDWAEMRAYNDCTVDALGIPDLGKVPVITDIFNVITISIMIMIMVDMIRST